MLAHRKMQLKLSLTGLLLWVFALSLVYLSCTKLLAKDDDHSDDPSIDCSVPEPSTKLAAILLTSSALAVMLYKRNKK